MLCWTVDDLDFMFVTCKPYSIEPEVLTASSAVLSWQHLQALPVQSGYAGNQSGMWICLYCSLLPMCASQLSCAALRNAQAQHDT
jgi:hypothetical protein